MPNGYEDYEPYYDEPALERPADPQQTKARETLAAFFDARRDKVFFSRQIEVMFEDNYFHWITNRAFHDLESTVIKSEPRLLKTGVPINIICHKSNRYYRRDAQKLLKIVNEYADPNMSAALGLHGEFMVLEAFARSQFVMRGRHTREFNDKSWKESGLILSLFSNMILSHME